LAKIDADMSVLPTYEWIEQKGPWKQVSQRPTREKDPWTLTGQNSLRKVSRLPCEA